MNIQSFLKPSKYINQEKMFSRNKRKPRCSRLKYNIPSNPLPKRIGRDLESLCYDEKFDSALILDSAVAFQKIASNAKNYDQLIESCDRRLYNRLSLRTLEASGVALHELADATLTPLLPALVIKKILLLKVRPSRLANQIRKLYRSSANIAVTSFLTQNHHILSGCGYHLGELNKRSLHIWEDKFYMFPARIHEASSVFEELLAVIARHKKVSKLRTHIDLKTLPARLAEDEFNVVQIPTLGENCHIILSHDTHLLIMDGRTFLLPHTLLLELYNKISELVTALIFTWMQTGVNFPNNHYVITEKFLKVCNIEVLRHRQLSYNPDKLFVENRGFAFLKTIEALGSGIIIQRSDKDKGWNNDRLIAAMWESLKDDKIVQSSNYKSHSISKVWDEMSISQIAETMGIVKVFGHPTIEIVKGIQQLNDRVHANLDIDPERVETCLNVIKRDLCIQFFKQHKRHFRCELNTVTHYALKQLITRSIDPAKPAGQDLLLKIPLSAWSNLKILKNAEFDTVENQLFLLKDKALGLTRTKVFQNVLCDLTDPDRPHTAIRMENRRALLAFLFSNDMTKRYRAYLSKYMEEEEWTAAVTDYLVVKLTAKELEFKAGGRYFGASPVEERNRRVTQELNVMSMMDVYVPEQLLTPSELGVLRKLVSFRQLASLHGDAYVFNISFDFSKWNNNFRSESVDRVASEILDNWYDVKLWSKTMKAFNHMLVYYNDPVTTQHWDGQLGGIEGLNQATWTLVFLGGVKNAIEDLGYTYHVSVKGDDVRAAIIVPKTSVTDGNYDKIRDELMNKIAELCKDMGWQLNPNESFVSLSLICTSKQYQVNNTWLPCGVKKAMKAESLSNLIFPTLEDQVASIFSIIHSTCSQSTIILPAFALASYLAARLLLRELEGIRGLFHQHIFCMLCWPQVLGGPGSLPLQTFFVRGENDMLSVSISLLRFITTNKYNISSNTKINSMYERGKAVAFKLLYQLLEDKPNSNLLLGDPYAICLDVPPRPTSILKNDIRDQLKVRIKNRDVKALITQRAEKQKEVLSKTLLTMKPFCPKIATAIWECTPFYLIDELCAKFLQSSTVLQYLSLSNPKQSPRAIQYKLLKKIKVASINRINYWFTVLTSKRIPTGERSMWTLLKNVWDDEAVCTTQITQKLREFAWGMPIYGITYPSLVDQLMYLSNDDVYMMHQYIQDTFCSGLFVNIAINQKAFRPQTDSDCHHYSSIQDGTAWLGSKTQSKMSHVDLPPNIQSPSIKKVTKLLSLTSVLHFISPKLVTIIEGIIGLYTYIPMELLQLLVPVEKGVNFHQRIETNSYSLTTMPNFRPNLAQLLIFSDESQDILNNDLSHRTINFAARYFYSTVMSTYPLQSSLKLPTDHPEIIFNTFHLRVEDNRILLCPYCCAKIEDIQIDIDISPDMNLFSLNNLALVTCSTHENTGLSDRITEVIARSVTQPKKGLLNQLPLEDQISAAAQILLGHTITYQKTLVQNLRNIGISKMPKQETIDIVASGLNIRPDAINYVSISHMKHIPPVHMYMCLVRNIVGDIIHCMATNDLWMLENDIDMIIDKITIDYEPVFAVLGRNGILSSLAEVSQELKWSTMPLIFRHGYEHKGYVSSFDFLSAHRDVLTSWICLTFPTPFNDLSIVTTVKSDLISQMMLAVKGVNRIVAKKVLGLIQGEVVHLDYMITSVVAFLDHLTFCEEMPVYNPVYAYRQVIDEAFTHWPTLRQYISLICYYLSIEGCLECSHIDDELINLSLEMNASVGLIELDDSNLAILRYLSLKEMEQSPYCNLLKNLMGPRVTWSVFLYYHRKLRDISLEYTQMIKDLVDPQLVKANSIWLPSMAKLSKRQLRVSTPTEAEASVYRWFMETIEEEPIQAIPVPDESESDDIIYNPIMTTQIMENNFHHPRFIPREGNCDDWIENLKLLVAPNNVSIYDHPRGYHPVDTTRVMGGLNKAIIRYEELFASTHINDNLGRFHNAIVVVIGDGAGSVSAWLVKKFRNLLVVSTSLAMDPLTSQRVTDAAVDDKPAELNNPFLTHEDRSRIIYNPIFPGDITLSSVRNYLASIVLSKKRRIAAIISDADYPMSDPSTHSNILMSCLDLYQMIAAPDTLLILRSFMDLRGSIMHSWSLILMAFGHSSILTMLSSRPKLREVFIYLQSPMTVEEVLDLWKINDDFFSKYQWGTPLTISSYIKSVFMRFLADFSSISSPEPRRTRKYLDLLTKIPTWRISIAPLISLFERNVWLPEVRQMVVDGIDKTLQVNLNNRFLITREFISRVTSELFDSRDKTLKIYSVQYLAEKLGEMFILIGIKAILSCPGQVDAAEVDKVADEVNKCLIDWGMPVIQNALLAWSDIGVIKLDIRSKRVILKTTDDKYLLSVGNKICEGFGFGVRILSWLGILFNTLHGLESEDDAKIILERAWSPLSIDSWPIPDIQHRMSEISTRLETLIDLSYRHYYFDGQSARWGMKSGLIQPTPCADRNLAIIPVD